MNSAYIKVSDCFKIIDFQFRNSKNLQKFWISQNLQKFKLPSWWSQQFRCSRHFMKKPFCNWKKDLHKFINLCYWLFLYRAPLVLICFSFSKTCSRFWFQSTPFINFKIYYYSFLDIKLREISCQKIPSILWTLCNGK